VVFECVAVRSKAWGSLLAPQTPRVLGLTTEDAATPAHTAVVVSLDSSVSSICIHAQ